MPPLQSRSARLRASSWCEAAHLLVVLELIMGQLEPNDDLVVIRLFSILEIDDSRGHLVIENGRWVACRETESRPDVAFGQHLSVEHDGDEIGNAIVGRVRGRSALCLEP